MFATNAIGSVAGRVRPWWSMVLTSLVIALSASVCHAGASGSASATADPLFTQPYVDIDEWRDVPVRHRYVHGGFKGTETLFSIYFPPKQQYQRRFFQPLNPTPGNENGAQRQTARDNPAVTMDLTTIAFAAASGAYLVESNMGSRNMFPASEDHTIGGFRASAAVAQYSRVLAAQMYGPHRPYGYVFGASGGSLKTISCIESTHGVWDGAVPYVTASDMAIPSHFAVQAHAIRMLKDKFSTIIDAVDPGGSGDMYAGLDDAERAALAEVTRMGFPPAAWFVHERIAFGYTAIFALFLDYMFEFDPKYFEDFWKVPGYLGASAPKSLRDARIRHATEVTEVVMSDEADRRGLPQSISTVQGAKKLSALRMRNLPRGDLTGAVVMPTSGAAAGKRVFITAVKDDLVFVAYGESSFEAADRIKAGDAVRIDNSAYLAAQTYYRHQVPPSREYYVWDQFRGPDGKPKYPQRPALLGPNRQEYAAGSLQSGRFDGKMIMVETLMDESAYAWSADWYRTLVKKARGSRLDDGFRLWFAEHALHGEPKLAEQARVVNYIGMVQQALRDLSAWVEKGVPPPASSNYTVVDGQVKVPAKAADRKGIQPVIAL